MTQEDHKAEGEEKAAKGEQKEAQGCNSIEMLNFGRKTGCQTGASSGKTSVLGHYTHIKRLRPNFGSDSGTKKFLLNCQWPRFTIREYGRQGPNVLKGLQHRRAMFNRAKVPEEMSGHLQCTDGGH